MLRFGRIVPDGRQLLIVATFVLGGAQVVSAQPQPCAGDCDGDGNIAIQELITGVNISLGRVDVAVCRAMDRNDSGDVAIAELVAAVNNALAGCPLRPTPTATSTAPAPTNTPEATDTPGSSQTPSGSQCVLSDESELTLQTANFPIRLTDLEAEIDIACARSAAALGGPVGDIDCTCELRSFDPILIAAIGNLCIAPFAGCETRPARCDGGIAVDVNVLGDHDIGECAGHGDCASRCRSYCEALGPGYTLQSSVCEDYCIGGPNDDQPCIFEADCPGGSCVGPDNGVSRPICDCACAQHGAGKPIAPAGLSCTLGLALTVEADGNGVCGDTPPAITLPPVCAELTTGTSVGQLLGANGSAEQSIGPTTLSGAPLGCSALTSGNLSGMKLVSHQPHFGTAIGDLVVENSFVCE